MNSISSQYPVPTPEVYKKQKIFSEKQKGFRDRLSYGTEAGWCLEYVDHGVHDVHGTHGVNECHRCLSVGGTGALVVCMSL